MKYLLIPLILLTGCADQSPFREKPIINGDNLTSLSDACKKLAKCIGGKASIVHFTGFRSNPFACQIDKTELDGTYFYPDLDTTDKEPSFGEFKQAIDACEMATQTGHHSPERLKQRRKEDERLSKLMQKDRKQREKNELNEAIQSELLPIVEYK